MTEPTPSKLSRAEWIAGAAFAISILQASYIAGVEVQRLNDQDRRITEIESVQTAREGKIEQLLIATTRIDANLAALTERANDWRGTRRR